jgi:hypothetical protein
MACMAELTYFTGKGAVGPRSKPTLADVHRFPNITILDLHGAKTVRPGKVQHLQLQPVCGILCSVQAIARCVATTRTPSDSLFGFETPTGRHNLTKQQVNLILQAFWHKNGKPEPSGHYFCVGGASLQNALRVGIDDINFLVR